MYVVSQPHRMRAHLTIGKVDRDHYERFHPLLTYLGLPKELWRELLDAVDSVPRITWDEFKRSGGYKQIAQLSPSGSSPGPSFSDRSRLDC